MVKRLAQVALWVGLSMAGSVHAAEAVDLDMVAKIRSEAFHRSQAAANLKDLTETIGPRLTNSPNYTQASAWARGKLSGWGLANVHDEVYDPAFGRGWAFRASRVEMLSPRQLPVHALPKAWTRGTGGPVEGEAVLASFKTLDDIEQQRGKLRGRIVLVDEERAYKPSDTADFQRYSEAELGELLTFPMPEDAASDAQQKRLDEYRKRIALSKALNTFFAEEGVLATLSISSWDNGIIRATGGGARKAGEPVGVTELVLPAEHYIHWCAPCRAGSRCGCGSTWIPRSPANRTCPRPTRSPRSPAAARRTSWSSSARTWIPGIPAPVRATTAPAWS